MKCLLMVAFLLFVASLFAPTMETCFAKGKGCGPTPATPAKPATPAGCKDLVWQCICDQENNCKWMWVCVK